MSTHESGTSRPPDASPKTHEAVGAYALGALDDAEATAFEEHLADCERCARQLDELAGMGPLLAALADPPDGLGQPAAEDLTARPGPDLAGRLLDEATVRVVRRRRRNSALVAAAIALIVGGPLAVLAVEDGSGEKPSGPAAEHAALRRMDQEVHATDTSTKVSATIGLERTAWGTHALLELKNVRGPQKCSLIAVGGNGDRETLASWAVPKWGYGIPDSSYESAKYPLYVHGGASLDLNDIDHFEVRTFDGRRLVEVPG